MEHFKEHKKDALAPLHGCCLRFAILDRGCAPPPVSIRGRDEETTPGRTKKGTPQTPQ
jgi:hypothetical protein